MEKIINKFELVMEKITIPILFVCCVYLIGRVLVSFVFGI